ncbi:Protein translocase subunit SecE [bacterium HR35]|nr:Protein translocase subunit SecE [bacterium HR35]
MSEYLLKLKNYLKETLAEIKKMNFITPEETFQKTMEVLFFSFFFLVFFALVDLAFLVLILNLK